MHLKGAFVFLFLLPSIAMFGDSGYTRYQRNNSTAHHIGIVGSIGYSTFLDDYPEITCIGNVGGTFGIEYEMRVDGFWFSLGPEIQYIQGTSQFNTSGTDVRVMDTYGVSTMYHYEFNKGLDHQRLIFANIPITLGFYYRGLYLGAGVKVGYAVYGDEKTTLQYTTTGTYQEYIDEFKQMTNHSYRTYTSSITQKLSHLPKFSILGEVGYDVLSWYRNRDRTITSGLKISAFVEYGLNNIVGGTNDVSVYSLNSQDASKIELNPFYLSRAGNSHHIHPLFAGIKISFLLCIKTKSCNCYDNWQYFNSRYNNMTR